MNSFTNAQVYVGDRPAEAVRQEVIAALRRKWLSDGTMVEAGEGESADVELAVGPATPEPWISVYDRSTEGQDTELLDRLVRDLSLAVELPVVGVLVYDSDLLFLRLCVKGKAKDGYISGPECFKEDLSESQLKKLAGRPAIWGKVFPWVSAEAIQTAWAMSEDTFPALTSLERVATCLRWNQTAVTTGFNSIEDKKPFHIARFKYSEAPAEALPPTQLGLMGWHESIVGKIGDRVNTNRYVYNKGRASRGVEVVLWGEALDREILRVESAELCDFRWNASDAIETRASECEAAGGGKLIVASFENYEIPALPPSARGSNEPCLDSCFSVSVHLTAEAPGESEIFWGIVPLANRPSGEAYRDEVSITPAQEGKL